MPHITIPTGWCPTGAPVWTRSLRSRRICSFAGPGGGAPRLLFDSWRPEASRISFNSKLALQNIDFFRTCLLWPQSTELSQARRWPRGTSQSHLCLVTQTCSSLLSLKKTKRVFRQLPRRSVEPGLTASLRGGPIQQMCLKVQLWNSHPSRSAPCHSLLCEIVRQISSEHYGTADNSSTLRHNACGARPPTYDLKYNEILPLSANASAVQKLEYRSGCYMGGGTPHDG